MKTKTQQLDELFQKWYSEQKKSDCKHCNHFSVDGLIKADDEDCIVLFVLSEPHSEKDNTYNESFWFRNVLDDSDGSYYKGQKRSDKRSITIYKKRIEFCAESLGLTDIPHGIAVMDMKKCGGGSRLAANEFKEYVDRFAWAIKKQIEILKPQYIVACGYSVFDALQGIGLDEDTKRKIIKTWHLNARKKNSEFTLQK